jgi:hypothetical protein
MIRIAVMVVVQVFKAIKKNLFHYSDEGKIFLQRIQTAFVISKYVYVEAS